MEKHCYLVLTQGFCETHKDDRVGVNRFNYGITKEGVYVCSVNAQNEFPFFQDTCFETIWLSPEDFKEQIVNQSEPVEATNPTFFVKEDISDLDGWRRTAEISQMPIFYKENRLEMHLLIRFYDNLGIEEISKNRTVILNVDNTYKIQGTEIGEYDYFANMIKDGNPFEAVVRTGIVFADQMNYINNKLV